MSRENGKSKVGMLTMLGYIFDKRDKRKLMFLTGAIVIGSFLELLAVMVFMPFVQLYIEVAGVQPHFFHPADFSSQSPGTGRLF